MCINCFSIVVINDHNHKQGKKEKVSFGLQFQRAKMYLCEEIMARQQKQKDGWSHFYPHLGSREVGGGRVRP